MSKVNLDRRSFLRGRSPKFNKAAIHPPWTRPIDEFITQCTRCSDCATACPTGIIIKGDGGYPEVDFSRGECLFCEKCIQSCKADAFIHNIEKTANNAWSLVTTVLPNCLSLNRVMCRACGDHCDVQAIRFQLKVGGIAEPIIQDELCTACGACLYVCPESAIQITAPKPST
jgi:ferredoxin-type protein NapF